MRDEWTIDPDRGLWLFRASRLEALLEPLDALLTQMPPAGVLASQTVLVGHPGLRPWLKQALAARRGRHGIVANVAFALPGPWLDGLAQSLLGVPPTAARVWQRDVLRWRLLPLLHSLDDAGVQALLARDAGTQAFALAERLAAALAPLMLYRPDWLAAWSQGRSAVRGDALLAGAWRALRTEGRGVRPLPHRGERLLQLARHLASAPSRPEGLPEDPLHVFGLHHLAPPELAVLRGLSRWRPVVLHVADPCREHWLGMGSGRAAMRAALNREDLGESDFLALDHPLLAAWGRLGQHFLLALEEGDLAVNERHGVDADDSAPCSLLERLQQGIRRNAPGLMRLESPAAFAALSTDASLRVHRCATPLRELEVLRDALAEAFATMPGLQPADVVVLSPDLARYRPLLPAVFGEPGRRDGAWPWHAADVPLSAMHPVYRALTQALRLPETPISAPGVLDLLAHPAVAFRFRLEAEASETLRHALARLGVAWGLESSDRQRFDAPADETHTFAWGLDRAMAGHVFGERDAPPLSLPDDTRLLPGEGIDAGLAERLGRLQALLLELREWAALGRATHAPAAWLAVLGKRLDGLLDAAPGDDDARDALNEVRAQLAALGEEWQDAGLSLPLAWPAVRDALQTKLDAVPERQRFLNGGLTFCGMVPQRAIPFRLVAVIGLDEGALPRHAPNDGFDLRAQSPRAGDRDLAGDDRYLFLETLMAARERLHLSFIGIGADDGRPRNPAAPLADLLETLARFVPAASASRPEAGWPWERRAALQPLAAMTSMNPMPAPRDTPAWPTANAAHLNRDAAPSLPSLDALMRFFRDPAKQALRDDAGVRLDGLEDHRLDENEPLEPKADRRLGLARDLVLGALERNDPTLPAQPPERLELKGLLPRGVLGDRLWRDECETAATVLRAHRLHPVMQALPLSAPRSMAVDLRLAPEDGDAGPVLSGRIDYREDAQGRWWLLGVHPSRSAKNLHFGQRVPLLLGWMALRLTQAQPVRVALLGATQSDGFDARIAAADEAFLAASDGPEREALAAELRQQLRAALAFRSDVLQQTYAYSPSTSWAAWAHDADEDKVRAAWAGGFDVQGERDYAPGYAALWRPDWHFAPGDGQAEALAADAMRLVTALPALRLDAAKASDASDLGDAA